MAKHKPKKKQADHQQLARMVLDSVVGDAEPTKSEKNLAAVTFRVNYEAPK